VGGRIMLAAQGIEHELFETYSRRRSPHERFTPLPSATMKEQLMIIRSWRTAIDPARADDYLQFARSR
jgi:hypothetical protein